MSFMYHHRRNMRLHEKGLSIIASGSITEEQTIYIDLSKELKLGIGQNLQVIGDSTSFNKCFPATICYVSYGACLSAELNDIKRRQSLRKIGVTMLSRCFAFMDRGRSIHLKSVLVWANDCNIFQNGFHSLSSCSKIKVPNSYTLMCSCALKMQVLESIYCGQ